MLREQLGFDFMLVVDTEGLKVSELVNKAQNEENELATFVIGLGNLTLINILGKDLSEIQDILQIALHAFLQDETTEYLTKMPICSSEHRRNYRYRSKYGKAKVAARDIG